MKTLDKITAVMQKIELVIGAAIVAEIFVLTVANIILRYFFNSPIRWSDEVILYSFIWLGFLTAAYALSRDTHVRFSLVTDKLPVKTQLVIKAVCDLLIIAGFAVLYPSAVKVIDFLVKTPALKVPEKYFYYIVPIGYALFMIHSALNFGKRLGELKGLAADGKGDA